MISIYNIVSALILLFIVQNAAVVQKILNKMVVSQNTVTLLLVTKISIEIISLNNNA